MQDKSISQADRIAVSKLFKEIAAFGRQVRERRAAEAIKHDPYQDSTGEIHCECGWPTSWTPVAESFADHIIAAYKKEHPCPPSSSASLSSDSSSHSGPFETGPLWNAFLEESEKEEK